MTILDFSRFLAGLVAALRLADLGAREDAADVAPA